MPLNKREIPDPFTFAHPGLYEDSTAEEILDDGEDQDCDGFDASSEPTDDDDDPSCDGDDDGNGNGNGNGSGHCHYDGDRER